jgi:hypothetical protein
VRLLVLLALLGGLGYLFGLGSRPIPRPPGVLAPLPPVQEEIPQGERVPLERPPYRLEPVARFHLEARVLGKRVYRADRAADLAPVDLALGWGRMSDTRVLERIRLWQDHRFYFYAWSGEPPIPPEEMVRSSANMHLIPADAAVERGLRRVRRGHLVRLSGLLVNVQGPQGFHWRTSTVRHDTGAGACEIVFVERLEVR